MIATAEKENLYHSLARMLGAGFPIQQAADSLLAQNPPSSRRAILLRMKEGLARGKSIAEALSPVVTPLETSMITAAENGGRLADGCAHLAEYFTLRRETISAITTRLIYPIILIHLAVVIPTLIQVLAGQGTWSQAVMPLMALWLAFGALYFIASTINRLAAYSAFIDRLLRLIPVVGGLRRALAETRFAKILQISLLSGLMPDDAVRSAADASASGIIRSAADRIVPQLKGGSPLGPQLRGVLGRDMADGLDIAEQAGGLDQEAGRWSAQRQGESRDRAQKLGFWLPAIASGIVMLSIAYRIVKMAMGYLNGVTDMVDKMGI